MRIKQYTGIPIWQIITLCLLSMMLGFMIALALTISKVINF
jgi:ABC-type arginine/histidine transport system permease subunit